MYRGAASGSSAPFAYGGRRRRKPVTQCASRGAVRAGAWAERTHTPGGPAAITVATLQPLLRRLRSARLQAWQGDCDPAQRLRPTDGCRHGAGKAHVKQAPAQGSS